MMYLVTIKLIVYKLNQLGFLYKENRPSNKKLITIKLITKYNILKFVTVLVYYFLLLKNGKSNKVIY